MQPLHDYASQHCGTFRDFKHIYNMPIVSDISVNLF